MPIHCPQCQTTVPASKQESGSIYCCPACSLSFSLTVSAKPTSDHRTLPLFLDGQQPPSVSETRSYSSATEMPSRQKKVEHLPDRSPPNIALWLSTVLFLFSIAGLWQHQEQWLQHPDFRHLLSQLHLPVSSHASDWNIQISTSTPEWLIRDDGSPILIVKGRITQEIINESLPPHLSVSAYSNEIGSEPWSVTLPITHPPLIQQLRYTPYIPPSPNLQPLKRGTSRNFTLVLENIPQQTGRIRLSPATIY